MNDSFVFDILLAEDNEADAELTLRALKKNNIANNIIHVKDGEEALEFIFATGRYASSRNILNTPKVILLDLKMPKVDGKEVLHKVKSDVRTKSIPVVMLTSSAEDPDIKECYRLGANSYIVKPIEFAGFSNAIKEIGFYWLLLNQLPS